MKLTRRLISVPLISLTFIALLGFSVPTTYAVEPYQTSSNSALYADFDGDGFDDLAIGVVYEDIGTITDAGAVHVLYGSSGGLQAGSPDDQFWHQDTSGVRDKCELEDYFGRALTAGDFNDDGFDDLAIGVQNENIGTTKDAGCVHVLYGSSGGLTASSPDDQLWHQDRPGVKEECGWEDLFGHTMTVGDYNNDDFVDLVVGAPFEDIGSIQDAGCVHVLYGASGGLTAVSPQDQLLHQDSPGVRDKCEKMDVFSIALS